MKLLAHESRAGAYVIKDEFGRAVAHVYGRPEPPSSRELAVRMAAADQLFVLAQRLVQAWEQEEQPSQRTIDGLARLVREIDGAEA